MFEDLVLVPHGICLSWNKTLIAIHEISDLTIAIFYFAIPWVVLKILGSKIHNKQQKRVTILCLLFVLFCGLSHLISVITIWQPIYWTLGIIKIINAITTVLAFIFLYPYLLKMSSQPTMVDYDNLYGQLRDCQYEKQRVSAENHTFKNCIEHSSEAIIVTDKNFLIQHINNTFTDNFGFTLEDIKNKPLNDIASGLISFDEFRELLINEDKLKWEGIVTMITKNEQKDSVPTILLPIRNNHNAIYSYVIILYIIP